MTYLGPPDMAPKFLSAISPINLIASRSSQSFEILHQSFIFNFLRAYSCQTRWWIMFMFGMADRGTKCHWVVSCPCLWAKGQRYWLRIAPPLLFNFWTDTFPGELGCLLTALVGVSGLFFAFWGTILLANNVDPGQTPHYMASDLGLWPFYRFLSKNGSTHHTCIKSCSRMVKFINFGRILTLIVLSDVGDFIIVRQDRYKHKVAYLQTGLIIIFICSPWHQGGGRVVRWCWVNFESRGVLLIWIRLEQGPTAPAVGEDGGCLERFILLSILSLFFLPHSQGDGPI